MKAKTKPARRTTTEMWRRLNRVQLAALLGVHPDTVTDYARSGMPVITRGGHGRESAYDAVACLAWWRQGQGKNAKEAAQTRAYEASAKLNELKLKRQAGELVSAETVRFEGMAYTRAWRSKILALPRSLVHTGVISREQEAGVAASLRELLVEISSWKTIADTERAAAAEQPEDEKAT